MESARGFTELVLSAGFHDWENGDTPTEAIALVESRDAAIRAECADRAWPLLKQEYEWRHEDSECGGDEISEGLDMLKIRLRAAIMGEEGR